MNLSLLFLLVNGLFDLISAARYSCERMLYNGALYAQCVCCYMVNHIEYFFVFLKHLEGHNEVGCNAGMFLVPPK